jgi:hypothetical protein
MMTQRSLTDENLEPWSGNIVDLTMSDGSHQTGLLERVDREFVRLRTYDGSKARPGDGLVRIAEAVKVMRAARN